MPLLTLIPGETADCFLFPIPYSLLFYSSRSTSNGRNPRIL
jgi:hypothetical protein